MCEVDLRNYEELASWMQVKHENCGVNEWIDECWFDELKSAMKRIKKATDGKGR